MVGALYGQKAALATGSTAFVNRACLATGMHYKQKERWGTGLSAQGYLHKACPSMSHDLMINSLHGTQPSACLIPHLMLPISPEECSMLFSFFFNPHLRTCFYGFFRDRGRGGARERERETLVGCLPHAPPPRIRDQTRNPGVQRLFPEWHRLAGTVASCLYLQQYPQ